MCWCRQDGVPVRAMITRESSKESMTFWQQSFWFDPSVGAYPPLRWSQEEQQQETRRTKTLAAGQGRKKKREASRKGWETAAQTMLPCSAKPRNSKGYCPVTRACHSLWKSLLPELTAKQQHLFLGDPCTLDPGCVPSHNDWVFLNWYPEWRQRRTFSTVLACVHLCPFDEEPVCWYLIHGYSLCTNSNIRDTRLQVGQIFRKQFG